MICLETAGKIRRYFFVDKKSIKAITRELNVSRNTVRRVLREDIPATEYVRTRQPRPQLGRFKNQLELLLEEDEKKPEGKRRLGLGLYQALKALGYAGAHDSVHRYAKAWREERKRKVDDVFIPLSFAPGDAYQFDWSHETLHVGGVEQTIKLAHLRLAHSRMFHLAAYPRESQEMVFDAHNRAFAYFGGVPKRGIYDNMKTAVDAVLHGRGRKFNPRFLQLCNHYLVEPVACTPASGWEKGQVENQVAYVRGRLFRPAPAFDHFDALNDWLRAQCMELAQSRRHPEFGDRTVWEVYLDEQAHLSPLPSPFPGYREIDTRVSPTSLVRFDSNRYSVDCRVAGKLVTLRSYAEHVEIWWEEECVGTHQRRFGRDEVAYDPWHYVAALLTKPGALRNGAPFANWDLPPSLAKVRKLLGRHPDADRQFVKILHAVTLEGLDPVETACQQSIADGTTSADAILNLIARNKEPPKPALLSVPDALRLTTPPTSDCSRYNQLLRNR